MRNGSDYSSLRRRVGKRVVCDLKEVMYSSLFEGVYRYVACKPNEGDLGIH